MYHVSSSTNIGNVLTSSVTVFPLNDTMPINNFDTLKQIIINSFDPNHKSVFQGPEIEKQFIQDNNKLIYTIYFQNIGTANAINIKIIDSLKSHLFIPTLQVISSSHNYTYSIDAWGKVQFSFQNINLPSINQDSLLSCGYIKYSVSCLPNTDIGDIIKNNAYIYFDNNTAIQTNTTNTIVKGNPIASFVNSPVTICEGDSIHFSNTSKFGESFQWFFQGGNPANSLNINPVVKFNSAGSHIVRLITINQWNSDTIIDTLHIVINPKPIAKFNSIDTLGVAPYEVSFNNTSLNSTTYYWDFGDGSYSTDINPVHTYQDSGIYTISLISYNSNCGSDTLIYAGFIRVSELVGIDNTYNLFSKSIVYPNPANDKIEVLGLKNCSIELANLQGQVIKTYSILNMKETIDISILSRGVYTMKITTGNGIIIKKMIKQ